MKNYLVKATRNFHDVEENIDRNFGDEFECTKERYEHLKSCNGAVEFVGYVTQPDEETKELADLFFNQEEIEELKEEKPKKTRKSKKK